MSIKIGERLPDGKLTEFIEIEAEGCSLGPNTFAVSDLTKGKKIVLFAVPGAFTPTCSAKHLPGYLQHAAAFKASGIDEIWALSVNDAFVMGAWGREQKVNGAIRLLADGNADFVTALGLQADFSKFGMGIRSQRFSAYIEDGVVRQLNVEENGKFIVSDAQTILGQLG